MQRRDTDIAVNGMSLRLTEWGPGEGRPLFMLHGIRGYAETFAGVAQALQPDFRVLAYDQRGRGASSWDPGRNYYTDAYVDDLAGVADALRVDSFDLLGHSMGGIAAIVFAARYPARVRRLIVEDAGPAAFEGSAGAARIQRELRETPQSFADLAAARAYLRALRPSVTEAAREERLRHMLKEDGAGGWTWRCHGATTAAMPTASRRARTGYSATSWCPRCSTHLRTARRWTTRRCAHVACCHRAAKATASRSRPAIALRGCARRWRNSSARRPLPCMASRSRCPAGRCMRASPTCTTGGARSRSPVR